MIIHTHDYDTDFFPAMPVIEIQIGAHHDQPPIILKAIVDSAADASMVPLRHLRKLNVRKRRTKWLLGTAGGRFEVDLYAIAMQIGNQSPIYIDVVGTYQRDEVIVGRDFLNHYMVLLNAPAHTVEVSI